MNTEPNTQPTDIDDVLNAALADLELTEVVEAAGEEGDVVEEVLEELTEEVIEELAAEAAAEGNAELTAADAALADDLLADLDLGLTKQEAYDSQEAADADPVGNKEKVAEAAKTRKEKKPRKAASGGTGTRTPRDINTVAPEFFALTEPDAGADLEAIKTATLALKPGQVKIAEKFENLFTALSVGKEPSTYVVIAFKLLDEKKSATSADIIAAYKASGLGEGTARSQSGQIMHLFHVVGIADRANQVLTLKEDSKIAERLRAVAK